MRKNVGIIITILLLILLMVVSGCINQKKGTTSNFSTGNDTFKPINKIPNLKNQTIKDQDKETNESKNETENSVNLTETVYVSKWNEKIKVSPRYSPATWQQAHANCSDEEDTYGYIICIGDFAAHHLDLTICLNLPTDQYIEQCILKAGSRLPSPTYCEQLDPKYINVSDDRWKLRCWRSAKHHFE